MIIRPIYNILLLPEVSFYFKKDFLSGWETEPAEPGTETSFYPAEGRNKRPGFYR